MGFISFFRKLLNPQQEAAQPSSQHDDLSQDEKALLAKIAAVNRSDQAISPSLYQQLRDFEVAWLERHYDFGTLDGICSIPVTTQPNRPPTDGITGEVYYYLRRKGYEHEKDGNIELGLACLRKSNELLKCKGFYDPEECYPLVKMLARAGYVEEAYKEKADIDKRCTDIHVAAQKEVTAEAQEFNTDLVIMDAHGSVCPECAKYQGRVYSISGSNKKFPKAPPFYYTLGAVHQGCSHIFWPYIDGVSDDNLAYTLSVHPLNDKRYGCDIVTFSNRPFVDDRTEDCKAAAADALKHIEEEERRKQHYLDTMIETEAKRGQELRDFQWLQTNIPAKCPASISGFRRMKTQNSKNYQLLQQLAAELGRKI